MVRVHTCDSKNKNNKKKTGFSTQRVWATSTPHGRETSQAAMCAYVHVRTKQWTFEGGTEFVCGMSYRDTERLFDNLVVQSKHSMDCKHFTFMKRAATPLPFLPNNVQLKTLREPTHTHTTSTMRQLFCQPPLRNRSACPLVVRAQNSATVHHFQIGVILQSVNFPRTHKGPRLNTCPNSTLA